MSGVLITSFGQWKKYVSDNKVLENVVVQGINFINRDIDWTKYKYDNTSFLNCKLTREQSIQIVSLGAFLYPKFAKLPYKPNRTKLYTHQELLKGYNPKNDNSTDLKIYEHFIGNRYNPPIHEAMAQRIHDFNIDESLRRLLGYNSKGMTDKKAVGFMGGHSTKRGSEYYVKVALAAKRLTESGYYITSGGGPGIMEAANLGAYLAGRTTENLYTAVDMLSDLKYEADESNPKDYLAENYVTQAQEVLKLFPDGQESLAIPTWFYGHEPSNVFATHIAKYFSNSLREDTLLAISLYGIVFAPGSAGTTQEIFQEAAQNHYGTFGYYSPMVFLGKGRYVEETSLYSVLHQLAKGQIYKDLLYLTDDPQLVYDFIVKHPPIAVSK